MYVAGRVIDLDQLRVDSKGKKDGKDDKKGGAKGKKDDKKGKKDTAENTMYEGVTVVTSVWKCLWHNLHMDITIPCLLFRSHDIWMYIHCFMRLPSCLTNPSLLTCLPTPLVLLIACSGFIGYRFNLVSSSPVTWRDKFLNTDCTCPA